jgi:DNA adenine methylase
MQTRLDPGVRIGSVEPPRAPKVLRSRHQRPGEKHRSVNLGPPLKWAGGKRWLVPYLKPLWEPYQHMRLVEPFVGGLGVTMGLHPRRAVLNDSNPHLINFYRWLQKGLIADLRMINSSAAFYTSRKRFNHLMLEGKEGTKEAAELFYYLNRTCYNGICRFNQSGGFNVPMGRNDVINYLSDFRPYVPQMKDWEFTVGDFESLSIGPSDFVYADPPYDTSFNKYSRDAFGWADHERLAGWLATLSNPVVLSNFASHRVVSLYRELGFSLKFYDAPRKITSNSERGSAREVLATRNLQPSRGLR